MNFKYLCYAALLLLILLSLLFFIKLLPAVSTKTCLNKEVVDASITVNGNADRRFLGFNADVDKLNFGKVSQLAIVQRSLRIKNSEDAVVQVNMIGGFLSWVEIEPSSFYLKAQETKEVFFHVTVPSNVTDGDYYGRAEICFKPAIVVN